MEDFVTYEIAKKLKEKGFPQHVCDDAYITENEYDDDKYLVGERWGIQFIPDYCIEVSAPHISQVLKWLREEKSLHIEVVSAAYGYKYIISDTPNKGGTDRVYSKYRGSNDGGAWDDYNECVFDAIEYVIDNLI